MKNLTSLLCFCLFVSCFAGNAFSQCIPPGTQVYAFVYNGVYYEIVEDNRSWASAAACAVARGGYLAEINSQQEQDSIFYWVNQAGIPASNTVAPDGGGASYLWIGGNDIATEGAWVWDGTNSGTGTQFWQGTSSGSPVGGLYNNWGFEPDDFNGQDALGLSLDGWPLGVASQWNDVDHTNMLYFVIEKPIQTGINEVNSNNDFQLYPNPAKNSITINNINNNVSKVLVINVLGKTLQAIDVVNTSTKKIDIAGLSSGTYYIKALSLSGNTSIKKFIK